PGTPPASRRAPRRARRPPESSRARDGRQVGPCVREGVVALRPACSSAALRPMSGGRGGGENFQVLSAAGNREVSPFVLLGARGDMRDALTEARPKEGGA